MQDLITWSTILPYFDEEAFVLKTQQQIAKDFAKFNLEFPEDFTVKALEREVTESMIQEQLSDIMRFGETRLLQLLYTIDISEKQFLNLAVKGDFIRELAQMILFREAYKVYLRLKFST